MNLALNQGSLFHGYYLNIKEGDLVAACLNMLVLVDYEVQMKFDSCQFEQYFFKFRQCFQ